jgi:hypothetical protein
MMHDDALINRCLPEEELEMLLSEYIRQLRDLIEENGDFKIVTDEDGEVDIPEFVDDADDPAYVVAT